MAYGMGNIAGFSVFASEMNGCPCIQIERTATIDLRPFIGSHPRHTMAGLASLPKIGPRPTV